MPDRKSASDPRDPPLGFAADADPPYGDDSGPGNEPRPAVEFLPSIRHHPYVIELEQRLKAACEPCRECGHWDGRELDDILDGRCQRDARVTAQDRTAALSDEQDVEVNYYVLVPFTTADASLWAAGRINKLGFDCHVVGRAAVDQGALLVKELS